MNRLLVFIIMFLFNLLMYSIINKYVFIFCSLIVNDMIFRLVNEYFHNTQLTYTDVNDNVVVVYFKSAEDKQKFIAENIGEQND